MPGISAAASVGAGESQVRAFEGVAAVRPKDRPAGGELPGAAALRLIGVALAVEGATARDLDVLA